MIVRRIVARACLAEPGTEVDQARRRANEGDPDWRRWIEEFDRDEATLVDLRVTAEIERGDGSSHAIGVENHQIWMHLAHQPPIMAGLVAELSNKDFNEIAARIHELGEAIDPAELHEMYVTVELADDLLAAMRPAATRARSGAGHRARPGTETENA